MLFTCFFLLMFFYGRFHLFNCARHSDYTTSEIATNDFHIFARTPPDSRAPRGWLVDLLNKYICMLLINNFK